MARPLWLDGRAELLARLLRERHQMDIDPAIAREDISDTLDNLAAGMRISRRAAQRYITDEEISKFADRIAHIVRRNMARRALKPQTGHLRVVRSWDCADCEENC